MKRLLLAASAAALLVALPAAASTIYDSGDATHLWTTVGMGNAAAEKIQFGSDVTITGLDAFMQTAAAADAGSKFTVDVWKDNGFAGDLLFSAEVTADPSTDAKWQGASGLSWTLSAGSYWIGVDSSDSGYMGSLWGLAPNPSPVTYFSVRQGNPGPWVSTRDADYGIRIFGDGGGPLSAGPAPGAVGGGSGTPEPAMWALMIGGFGLAGTTLRRRRQAVPVS